MKKVFVTPKVELVMMSESDVLTTSVLRAETSGGRAVKSIDCSQYF